jgi:VIT1/CCC1 family predicted Fe2+/Mn2+ transporter
MPLLLLPHSTDGTSFLPVLLLVSGVVLALLCLVIKWVEAADKSRRMLGKLVLAGLVGGVFFLAFKFVEALAG